MKTGISLFRLASRKPSIDVERLIFSAIPLMAFYPRLFRVVRGPFKQKGKEFGEIGVDVMFIVLHVLLVLNMIFTLTLKE